MIKKIQRQPRHGFNEGRLASFCNSRIHQEDCPDRNTARCSGECYVQPESRIRKFYERYGEDWRTRT